MYLVAVSLQGQEFLSALFIVSPVPGRKTGQNRSLRNICRFHELNPWLLCSAGHPLSVLYMTEWCLYLSGFAWAKMCHTGFRKRLMDPSGSLGFSGAQFEKNSSCPSLRVSSYSCMHIITFLSFFLFFSCTNGFKSSLWKLEANMVKKTWMALSTQVLFLTFQLLLPCIPFSLHTLKLLISLMVVVLLCGKLKFWLMVKVVKFGSIGFCKDKENVMILGRSYLWMALITDKKIGDVCPGKKPVNFLMYS